MGVTEEAIFKEHIWEQGGDGQQASCVMRRPVPCTQRQVDRRRGDDEQGIRPGSPEQAGGRERGQARMVCFSSPILQGLLKSQDRR